MEFDFWWLPGAALFFALGWLASRKESSKQTSDSKSALPEAYLRGLQSLLGDDQVRAIDAFTDLVRKEPDSLELHLALGHLFRRKGETDRAIRVHQNLLARQDLTSDQRAELFRELALDYVKAGLFDRAEQALQSLSDSPLRGEALRLRLDIAQRVRDWTLALSIAQEIVDQDSQGIQLALPASLLAHLHAEIAHQLHQQGNIKEAIQALQKAQAACPDHPRSWIDHCLLCIDQSDHKQADAAAKVILERWPEHAARIASPWLQIADAAGIEIGDCLSKVQRFELLEKAYRRAASSDLLAIILEHLEILNGPEASQAFLSTHREHHKGLLSILAQVKGRALNDHQQSEKPPVEGEMPRMAGEKPWANADPSQADAQILAGKLADDEAVFKTLTPMLEQLARYSSRYVCQHCGFQANRHYWQCPGCQQWDRYPPQRTDEMPAA